VQCSADAEHNALRVFKWKCAHYGRVVRVAQAGNSSALNCHGGRPFPPPHRPPRLDTCTRTLIPVLSVDKDQLGRVKVGSNNLGEGNAFDPMSAARRFYWPHQQQMCCHRAPLNGNDTALVDEDLNTANIAYNQVVRLSVFCWRTYMNLWM
jgi:hypothetical protein